MTQIFDLDRELDLARGMLLPEDVARLNTIVPARPDPQNQEGETDMLPPVDAYSLRSFRIFAHTAQRFAFDLPLLPGRSDSGLLSVQFCNPVLGDIIIHFYADGSAVTAVTGGCVSGHVRQPAERLLGKDDLLMVQRWVASAKERKLSLRFADLVDPATPAKLADHIRGVLGRDGLVGPCTKVTYESDTTALRIVRTVGHWTRGQDGLDLYHADPAPQLASVLARELVQAVQDEPMPLNVRCLVTEATRVKTRESEVSHDTLMTCETSAVNLGALCRKIQESRVPPVPEPGR